MSKLSKMSKRVGIGKVSRGKGKSKWFTCVGLAGVLVSAMVCQGCMGSHGGSGGSSSSSGTAAPADAPAAAPTAGQMVEIASFKFQPATLEVKPGTAVTWRNGDPTSHTVWSGTPDAPKDGPLHGNLKPNGGTYTYTFKEAGEYPYYCDFHNRMTGKVVVK